MLDYSSARVSTEESKWRSGAERSAAELDESLVLDVRSTSLFQQQQRQLSEESACYSSLHPAITNFNPID
jgi:hypothetical protein